MPRFTLAELREVLQEKNILKARVMELEEQLDFYRGKSANSDSQKDDSDTFRWGFFNFLDEFYPSKHPIN